MIVETILPRAFERLVMLEAEAPVREAAALMSEPRADLIVVCDHGDMVGVLTKTDIVGQISRCMGSACTARVDSIMTRDVSYYDDQNTGEIPSGVAPAVPAGGFPKPTAQNHYGTRPWPVRAS